MAQNPPLAPMIRFEWLRFWLTWAAWSLVAIIFWGREARTWSPAEIILASIGWVIVYAVLERKEVSHAFGPVFFYELIRLGRKRVLFMVRLTYVLFLLAAITAIALPKCEGLFSFSDEKLLNVSEFTSRMSAAATTIFEIFILVQLVVVMFLTPLYTAGTIAEEKERKTLEFLFATDLSGREIVFGKTAARLAPLIMLILAGFPVIAMLQLFGGIDPDQFAVATAATLVTVIGITSFGIYMSVKVEKARDAIGMTYIITVLYLIGSATIAGYFRSPLVPIWLKESGLQTVSEWFASGNIVWVFASMSQQARNAAFTHSMLMEGLGRYVFFWSIAIIYFLGVAVFRLRPTALRRKVVETTKSVPRTVRLNQARNRPAIGNDPMMWKEIFLAGKGGGSSLVTVVIIALVFLVPIVIVYNQLDELSRSFPDLSEPFWEGLARKMNTWVRIATGVLGTLAMLAAAMRGATAIGEERDKDTWISLLSSPLTSKEILRAKWFGCVLGLRKIYLAILVCWALALSTDATRLDLLIIDSVFLYVYISAFSWLGILMSIISRTTSLAILRTIVLSVFFVGGFWLLVLLWDAGRGGSYSDTDIIMHWFLGVTPAFVVGWWPLREISLGDLGFGDVVRHSDLGPIPLLLGFVVWSLIAIVLRGFATAQFAKLTFRGPNESNNCVVSTLKVPSAPDVYKIS